MYDIIIDAIKKYIEKECPLVSGKKIKVNNLGENPTVSLTIDQLPCIPIIKRYVDGSTQRQFQFVFASREEYDSQEWKQIEAAQFYENLQEWFEEQSANKTLPVLENGLFALRLEVLSSGYLISSDAKTARYQIQCRLIYYKERK